MANGYRRRRISANQYLTRIRSRRPNFMQYGVNKRRRFIRASGRYPVYRRYTRFTPRPLGNPLAITERKYHDVERTVLTLVPPVPDWSVCIMDPYGPGLIPGSSIPAYSFNAIPVGTTWQQRIGRKVQLLSLRIKGEVGINSGSNAASAYYAQTIRIIVYQDMQNNGNPTSNPADVLHSGPTNVLAPAYFQSGENFGRYKILNDTRFVLNPYSVYYNYSSSISTINSIVKLIDYNFNFNPPLTVHYNSANTNTNQDIVDNSIHMAVCCDNPNTPNCFIWYKARVTFFDA